MSPSSPDLPHYRIRRKPPPSLDISERYPSPDPLDPFAPLWVLRNRTSSRLSSQDILESNIVTRTGSHSYLYSTATAQVSLNTSISPIRTPSPKVKIGHYRPYSQATFDSPQVFPLISSPLTSQPDLHYPQRANVTSPQYAADVNDGSSGSESDTASIPFPTSKPAFIQPSRTPSSNYRFPEFLLLRKLSFLGSGNEATGNRSSMIEFKQIQKSDISPPVVSTVTWVPSPVGNHSINGQSASKSLSADLMDCASLTLTNDNHQHHQHHQHHKRHPMTSDNRKHLKQDLPRPRKLYSIPISPKMLRKRISSGMPFSSTSTPSTTSTSSSSYVHISTPTPVPSLSQHTSEDAYASPRKAPAPPPVYAERDPKQCPDKLCRNKCIHSTSSEWDPPSRLQLHYAASLPVTGDDGKQIPFGSLFESQSTIVIFIRHFWCPLCQDYMSSVKSFVRPEMVCNSCESDDQCHDSDHDAGTRVRFVVISNGAHGMIAKYKQIFGLPFNVYTDPTLALYQALGMGRDRDIKHHNYQTHRHSPSKGGSSEVISEKKSDIKDSGYVKHSLMGGIAMVVMRALKVCMPVWEKGGNIDQLGGEFIFGPGLTCTYAHRMKTTKGHAPIQDVLQAAGISIPNSALSAAESRHAQPAPTAMGWSISEKVPRRRRESVKIFRNKESNQVNLPRRVSRRYSVDMISREEEERWMERRQNSVERLREKKNMRRGMNRATSSQSQYRQPLTMEMVMNTPHIEDLEGERSSPTPTPAPAPAPVDVIS